MRPLVLSLLGMLALAAPASASDPIRVTMTTTTARPLVGEPWGYTITVSAASGRTLPAKARITLLRGMRVVGCVRPRALVRCSTARAGTWIHFRRSRRQTFIWPALGVGRKLTFRATVVVDARKVDLDTAVTVQPRP
jgi:hypothetical protein